MPGEPTACLSTFAAMSGEPAAMPGEPTTCGSCRPVAREETFYEFEADVPIVAVG